MNYESKGTDDDKIKIAILCPKNRYIKGAAVSWCHFAMHFKCDASFIFLFQLHKAVGISDVASQCFKHIDLCDAKSDLLSFICEPYGPLL